MASTEDKGTRLYSFLNSSKLELTQQALENGTLGLILKSLFLAGFIGLDGRGKGNSHRQLALVASEVVIVQLTFLLFITIVEIPHHLLHFLERLLLLFRLDFGTHYFQFLSLDLGRCLNMNERQ